MFIIFGKITTEFSEIFMQNIFFVVMSKKNKKKQKYYRYWFTIYM